MTGTFTLAVDAMGGDKGAITTIEGVCLAADKYPFVNFLVFGQEKMIQAELQKYKNLEGRVEIIHTDEVVKGEDKPSLAIRRGRKSSMGLAIASVKDGRAQVAVSSGNTGALMALAKITLRTMEGIDRPALVTTLPALKKDVVMLDLGANVECSEHNLVQFAIMGTAYARTVLKIKRPKVGILNVGVEELKGSEAVKNAAAILRANSSLPMEFTGYVEGDRIGIGGTDVIVTDGFTGNIAIKTAEGTAKLIRELMRRAFGRTLFTRLGYLFAKPGLDWIRIHLDPNTHNGAVFLGLNGLVVKSHGGASAFGFSEAIKAAVNMSKNGIIPLIKEDLENFQAPDLSAGEQS